MEAARQVFMKSLGVIPIGRTGCPEVAEPCQSIEVLDLQNNSDSLARKGWIDEIAGEHQLSDAGTERNEEVG